MIKIETNGNKTLVSLEGKSDELCAEFTSGVNAAYRAILGCSPRAALVLKKLLTLEVLSGSLF